MKYGYARVSPGGKSESVGAQARRKAEPGEGARAADGPTPKAHPAAAEGTTAAAGRRGHAQGTGEKLKCRESDDFEAVSMSIETDMSDRDYEILVQNIHRSIMLNEGMSNVEVQHDVKIEGRSGDKHQVDVFWSFTLAGITYRTAVECRKYKSPISVGRIRDFAVVLDHIGNINEIMVTTRGYQIRGRIICGRV